MDAHPIQIKKDQSHPSIIFGIDIFSTKNIKSVFLLIFLYLLINSDYFINYVLSKFNDTVDQLKVTTSGIIIQGLILVFLFAIGNLLIDKNII
jgi:hypothetical protein